MPKLLQDTRTMFFRIKPPTLRGAKILNYREWRILKIGLDIKVIIVMTLANCPMPMNR